MSDQTYTIGQVLPGGYVIKEISDHEGAYGQVYYVTKDQQNYAVKIQAATVSGYLEVSLLTNLNHPGIIKPVQIITSTGSDYFYIYQPRGVTKPSSDVDFLVVTYRLLAALAYLEIHGVIHCDVKNDNIVFLDGQPVLIDFGVSQLCPGSERVCELVNPGGDSYQRVLTQTTWYRSPEMWQQEAYDARIDVFSLGCCLYRWLSGRYLFQTESLSQFEPEYADVAAKISCLTIQSDLLDINHQPERKAYYQHLLTMMLAPRQQRPFASQLLSQVVEFQPNLLDHKLAGSSPSWRYPHHIATKLADCRSAILANIGASLDYIGLGRPVPLDRRIRWPDDKGVKRGFSTVERTSRLHNGGAWTILAFTVLQQLVAMVLARSNYLPASVTFLPGGCGQLDQVTLTQAASLAVYLVSTTADFDLQARPTQAIHTLAEFYQYNNQSILVKTLLDHHTFKTDQDFAHSDTIKFLRAYRKHMTTEQWNDLEETSARAFLVSQLNQSVEADQDKT